MRKPSKSRRTQPDRAATTDVVTQLECAVKRPHATAIGAVIGGVVPWFAHTLAHEEVPAVWSGGNHPIAMIMILVVLGCAVFSALTVYKFGKAAFGDSRKALGFVLAIEGVMLLSRGTTSTIALVVLVVINALANGSVIALAREATCKRREADERRARTRARSRAVRTEQTDAPVATAPATASRARRPVQVTGYALVAPVWRRATLDDVIDAEIVSEERILA
jgi:hypothetical protein